MYWNDIIIKNYLKYLTYAIHAANIFLNQNLFHALQVVQYLNWKSAVCRCMFKL